MNLFLSLLIPCIFLSTFLYATIKKVKVYDSFCGGAKDAIPLIVHIFPYIAATMMLSQIFQSSGLQTRMITWLSPAFQFFGIPQEIAPLLFIKPLSGSGSIAVLSEILSTYGVDSYIARCACVTYGASETVFYIGAVYFAGVKQNKLTLAMAIALFSYVCSIIVCCFLCRIL